MKARIPRQEFLDALQAVALLTSGRTTRPILNCVKLDLSKESLELSGTDGESGLRISLPTLTTDKTGQTVVSADRLLQIVREFPDVELKLAVTERHCVISGEGSEFKIFVQNAADFPPVPTFSDAPDLVIDGRLLARAMMSTSYAVARETGRYAINGVLWQKQAKHLYLVATDGRRLARSGMKIVESTAGDFEAIVPAKAVQVFEKVFVPREGADAAVQVKLLPTQILLRFGSRVLSAALVDGHFPNYQDVIPRENDKRVTMSRSEFHAGIRRAALLTTEDARAVRLQFDKERLTISSSSPEQGEARIEMPVEGAIGKLDIGFNPSFLNDALKVLTFDRVALELSESFKPGVLCGDDKDEFLYVIMPVTLS